MNAGTTRVAKTFLGAALALGLVACGGDDAPVVPAEAALPSAPVEVLVDDMGVPHIYAQNDQDLFYGYGYQLASDRMLQLDMFRRFAHGRLSEVFGADGPGAAGANTLIDDRFARIFNWKHWGLLDAEKMAAEEPEHYALTSAWVAGINARVAEIEAGTVATPFGYAELGINPEPWTPEDVYIVQKMVGFGLDQSLQYEIFVTFAELFSPDALEAVQLFKPAHDTFVLPESERPGATAMNQKSGPFGRSGTGMGYTPDVDFGGMAAALQSKALGSNNWAVDGTHTEAGTPIIAGDPHLGYSFSGITYALHLNSMDAGGTFDVAGFSFVGAPGIFAGHNRDVAYTETSAFADVMDMWEVEITDDGVALVGGEEIAVVKREEVIDIKGGEPEVIEVTEIPGLGVVVPHTLVGSPIPIAATGKEAVLGWTGFKARPARFFRGLMRVGSLDEFEEAVLGMPEMTYNFVAADVDGISYRVGVEVPARNPITPERRPYTVMDGSDPMALWPDASLTAEQLPHSRGADRGWIATANNDPYGFTADGQVDNDPFYYSAIFPPGWRAHRIESEIQRLIGEGPITVEQMQLLQGDDHSNLADQLVPLLVTAWENAQTDPTLADFAANDEVAQLVQLLTVDWDGRMERSSSGAVAFHAWAHLLTEQVMGDDLISTLYNTVLNTAPMYLLKVAALALEGRYPNGDQVLQEGRDAIILAAVERTAGYLVERFGTVDPSAYTFADMRVSSMAHAYGRGVDLGEVPTDGGESTVNVAQSHWFADPSTGELADRWISHWGPIERQVMDFDADGVPRSYVNFPQGNVADENSPHFADAMSDWVEDEYRLLRFHRDEIEAATETTIVLAPK